VASGQYGLPGSSIEYRWPKRSSEARESRYKVHTREYKMRTRLGKIARIVCLIPVLLIIACEDEGTYVPEPADVVPPQRVTTLEAVMSGDSTVTLTWLAAGDDPRSGVATKYEIRYQKAHQTNPWWKYATPLLEVESTAPYVGLTESVTISGLLPGARYFFALKAADEVPNWSEMSNVADALVTPVDVTGRWGGWGRFFPSWVIRTWMSLDLIQSRGNITGTCTIWKSPGEVRTGVIVSDELMLVVRFEREKLDYIFAGTLNGNSIEGVWTAFWIPTGDLVTSGEWQVSRTGR
jgi:hypothetical protein